MIEKSRQIVIFGNFESINFENITKLFNLKDKYSLVLSANEDIQPISPNLNQQFVINTTPPILRPAFISNDRNFTVFFGTKRIHIEEKEVDIDSFDSFFEKAKEFIFKILECYSLVATRAAINGTVFETDQSFINSTYSNYFKVNQFFSEDMDDRGFRFNYKSKSQNNKLLNRIVSAQLRKEIIDNTPKNALYLSYDYNTFPNQTFENENELLKFFDEGKEFRRLVLKDENNIE